MSRMQGKALPKGAQAPNYAGIDVCKDWLDAKLRPSDKAMRVANDASGHKRLSRFMADNGVVLIVMEATGKYHRAAPRSLYANGFAVAVVNPKRARSFAESIGALAKTDEVDASVLAMMGETLRPDATPPASKALGKMQELVRARQAALADRTAMQNRMGESTCDAVRESLNAVIEAINSAVAKLDAEIAKLIAGDGGLSRRMEILVSIPGVGPVTAASLIADLPELGECDDKAMRRSSASRPSPPTAEIFAVSGASVEAGRRCARRCTWPPWPPPPLQPRHETRLRATEDRREGVESRSDRRHEEARDPR